MQFQDMFLKMWATFMEIAPIARWVEVTTNALRFFALLETLLAIPLLLLVVGVGPFSEGARLGAIGALLFVMLLTGLGVFYLAQQPRRPLYSAYENSLRAGRLFGTESNPASRDEIEGQAKTTANPRLPPPPDQSNQNQLTGD